MDKLFTLEVLVSRKKEGNEEKTKVKVKKKTGKINLDELLKNKQSKKTIFPVVDKT